MKPNKQKKKKSQYYILATFWQNIKYKIVFCSKKQTVSSACEVNIDGFFFFPLHLSGLWL